eukprot:SAG31_NODE_106_length_24954_cov_17.726413_6_plen_110_part_00
MPVQLTKFSKIQCTKFSTTRVSTAIVHVSEFYIFISLLTVLIRILNLVGMPSKFSTDCDLRSSLSVLNLVVGPPPVRFTTDLAVGGRNLSKIVKLRVWTTEVSALSVSV